MKKLLCFLLATVICVSLAGCGNSIDPVGEYKSQCVDVSTLLFEFLSGFERPTITIEKGNENYVYTDKNFKGSAEIHNDRLVLSREEVTDARYKDLLEDQLGEKDTYFMYEDYLISTSSSVEVEYGNLPQKDFADFGVTCIYDFSPFSIDFFDDGSCKFEFKSLGQEYLAEGGYEMRGQMIYITFSTYEELGDNDSIKSGESKFALFIKDGAIYDGVYQKTE